MVLTSVPPGEMNPGKSLRSHKHVQLLDGAGSLSATQNTRCWSSGDVNHSRTMTQVHEPPRRGCLGTAPSSSHSDLES